MAKGIFEAFGGQQDASATRSPPRVGFHMPESMAEQMELAYRNVAETLAHFAATMSDVLEQWVYVTSINEAAAVLDVRKAAYVGQGSTGFYHG